MMMKYIKWTLIIFVFLILPIKSFAAYDSQICVSTGKQCTETEVGPFMKGITKECGNLGNCSLDDIMEVVANVGNFIAGIVGGIVLLMYIVGGMYYIFSGGKKENVDKAKKYITGSTVGLLIIIFAFIGIQFLQQTLGVKTEGGSTYVICDGASGTEGQSCGLEQICSGGSCQNLCTVNHGGKWQCKTVADDALAATCETNVCGSTGTVCCPP